MKIKVSKIYKAEDCTLDDVKHLFGKQVLFGCIFFPIKDGCGYLSEFGDFRIEFATNQKFFSPANAHAKEQKFFEVAELIFE